MAVVLARKAGLTLTRPIRKCAYKQAACNIRYLPGVRMVPTVIPPFQQMLQAKNNQLFWPAKI